MIFTSMIIAELVILIESLLPSSLMSDWWSHITIGSVFVQWIALVSNTILCLIRPALEKLSTKLSFILAFQVVPIVTTLSSILFFILDQNLQLGLTVNSAYYREFILGNGLISTLVSAAAFRYLYIQTLWRKKVESDARSRFEALQARIRPHFLFNSMNTIASLIRREPNKAEEAVLDLSDLFRSALHGQAQFIPLSKEFALSKSYLKMEQLRMGERLTVQWEIDSLLVDPEIPPFIIQPLVENAIYHGIQNIPEGGIIHILAKHDSDNDTIEISISNPTHPGPEQHGNDHAIKNIKERLEYIYQDNAQLHCLQEEHSFHATLRIPAQ